MGNLDNDLINALKGNLYKYNNEIFLTQNIDLISNLILAHNLTNDRLEQISLNTLDSHISPFYT